MSKNEGNITAFKFDSYSLSVGLTFSVNIVTFDQISNFVTAGRDRVNGYFLDNLKTYENLAKSNSERTFVSRFRVYPALEIAFDRQPL